MINPQRHYFKKNNDFKFICKTAAPLSARWFFNNRMIPKNARILTNHESILLILKANKKNIGFYECVGTTNLGRGYFSAIGVLKNKGNF